MNHPIKQNCPWFDVQGKARASYQSSQEGMRRISSSPSSLVEIQKMQRSPSSSQIYAKDFFHFFNKPSSNTNRVTDYKEQLPTYDPLSHIARKERARLRSAENAVHIIPLVLILCGIILWFFSNPGLRF